VVNKYYIPELEEFHVGFRFESSVEASLIDSGKGNTWNDDCLENFVDFDGLGDNENLRVKYLDRADIEELGWGNYKRSICDWYEMHGFFTLKNELKYMSLRLQYCHDRNTIKIEGYEYTYLFEQNKGEEILFYGECKNYNELKNIMKLIGII